MKAIMGLIARRSGTVRFNGDDISRLQAVRDRAPRPRLYAGGPPHLFRSHGAWKISTSAASRRAVLPTARRRRHGRRTSCSRCFPISPKCRHRLGDRMSGGEQQMLTVARTLMGNPLLVLLDEPSEGVAPLIVEQMANTIVELKKEGLSILLSEQNIHFARLVSDRVYVLEKGQIRWPGDGAARRQRGRAARLFDGLADSAFASVAGSVLPRRQGVSGNAKSIGAGGRQVHTR